MLPILIKYSTHRNILQIMITFHQIIDTIPWLSCKELPYPSKQSRILRVRQRDKSRKRLLSSAYKYILHKHSSSTLPFQSFKTYSPRRRPWRATVQLQLARTLPKQRLQALGFILIPLNGDQLQYSCGQSYVHSLFLQFHFTFASSCA